MTILVTGAGGFLGGRLCAALRGSGVPVRGLDLHYPAGKHQDDVTGSILEQETLSKVCNGIDGVIHAAALAHLWTPGRFDYDRVNGIGTCRVLAAARRAGAPIVMVSSYTTLIDRDVADRTVLDETAEIVPNRLLGRYPVSKRQAELFVQAAAGVGQQACIVMPSAPVGPGDFNLTPPSAMIRDLALGKTPALLDCLLNLVDVRAVADATIKALDSGAPGRRYLLAGESTSLPDLAARVATLSGRAAPRTRVPLAVALAAARVEALISRFSGKPPRAPLTGVRLAARKVEFDSARAKSELEFSPRSLDEVLFEAVEWLIAHQPQG